MVNTSSNKKNILFATTILGLISGITIRLFIHPDMLTSIALTVIGLYVIFTTSEEVTHGFDYITRRLGFSQYVAGIISSLASNLPEIIIALILVMNPLLREVAILTVILAAAFNLILLGILIIMLTYKGGYISIPRIALERDIEVTRLVITMSFLIFGAGIIINVFHGEPYLPREIMIFPLISYLGYMYFLSKERDTNQEDKAEAPPNWKTNFVLGMISILLGAEFLSSSAEYFTEILHFNPVITATMTAFAGSVPEHGIAIIAARKGYVEMGISNLLSGVIQSIMLVLAIVALVVPLPLDGYILFQLLVVSASLWLVKKAVTDDSRLTLDEGLFILLAQVMGIVLLDELSMLI
ncbi:hypothetical protein DRJ16_00935 [Candidatus Woesearchaeota archaeon]|nr:MAG: hypothetical protein DRJ16_00935 [Candidatus Woesearchaeota archaeon]